MWLKYGRLLNLSVLACFCLTNCEHIRIGSWIPGLRSKINNLSWKSRKLHLPSYQAWETGKKVCPSQENHILALEKQSYGIFSPDILAKLFLMCAEKVVQIGFTYFIMRLALRFVHSVRESLSYSEGNQKYSEKSDLQMFLINNKTTFNTIEKQLLGDILLPNDIEERWEDIGGLEQTKRDIKFIASRLLEDENKYSNKLLQPIKSIMLFGPPGCGKTALGRSLAHLMKFPILSVKPSSILRPYLGESSMNIKGVFTLAAKLRNVIILIDEMDSMFKCRSLESRSDTTERQIKTEFMDLWDNLKRSNRGTLVIGITNRLNDLDPAIHRRFERSFFIDIPNIQNRVDIFRCLLRNIPKDKMFNYYKCAKVTDGYTGNDIFEVCKIAAERMKTRNNLKNSYLKSFNTTLPKQTIEDKLKTQVMKFLVQFYTSIFSRN